MQIGAPRIVYRGVTVRLFRNEPTISYENSFASRNGAVSSRHIAFSLCAELLFLCGAKN